jgi:Tfp pilus assembly protein PilN
VSQQVNLYSPIFRRQEKKFSAYAMLQAIGLILVGIALFIGLNVWRVMALRSDLKSAEQRQTAVMKQFEDAKRQFTPRVGDPKLEEEVAKLEAILAVSGPAQAILRRDVFGESRGYSTYFIALARQSVADLWLTGIDITGAGQTIQLSGRARVPERVPQYLQKLSSEKVLSGSEFKVFRLDRPEEKDDKGQPLPVKAGKKPALAPYVEFVIRTADATAKAGKP